MSAGSEISVCCLLICLCSSSFPLIEVQSASSSQAGIISVASDVLRPCLFFKAGAFIFLIKPLKAKKNPQKTHVSTARQRLKQCTDCSFLLSALLLMLLCDAKVQQQTRVCVCVCVTQAKLLPLFTSPPMQSRLLGEPQ